jgi:23S rRNA (guanosine2251-2'-O)-methyltransferase
VFGLNPVAELMRASPRAIETLYVARGVNASDRLHADAAAAGLLVESVERAELETMTGGAHHQGVAARTRAPAAVDIEDVLADAPPMVAVLDGIQDPQNLGAIIRAAEVLGAGAMLLPKDRSAGVSPAVVRASSGAALHLRVAAVVNLVRALERLKESGYWIVGLDARGASKFQDLPRFERVELVVGSEGRGMRPLVARSCDFVVAIPVRGKVASLNAATAAAIGFHELASRLGP